MKLSKSSQTARRAANAQGAGASRANAKGSAAAGKHVSRMSRSTRQTKHVKRSMRVRARLAGKSWLQAKLSDLDQVVKNDKSLRIVVPIGVILIFVVSLIVLNGGLPKLPGSGPSAEDYKEQLQAKVDDENGAPRNGRDPANQGQTSLSDAANQPTGAGTHTDTPAAGVVGDHDHHVTQDDIYDDAGKTRISAAGCYIDYGIQGEQCLPSHVVGFDGKITCSAVRSHGFEDGLKVNDWDWAGLDTNDNGIACDKDDKS